MQEETIRCKFCKVKIPVATAKRTNGYCMPHAWFFLAFRDKIGGIIETVEEVKPSEIKLSGVKKNFRLGIGVEWNELLKKILPTDKFVRFHSSPLSPEQEEYAATGYAIIRNNHEWVEGIVTEWKSLSPYYQDIEEPISLGALKGKDPYVWKKLRKYIENGDTVVYFKTSRESWDKGFGREGYAIKRNGKLVRGVVTVIC